jgi:hypothetical protein
MVLLFLSLFLITPSQASSSQDYVLAHLRSWTVMEGRALDILIREQNERHWTLDRKLQWPA